MNISVAINRETWLNERRGGIGGSDAAAVVGLNPYKTPYMVWADKTDRLPEPEDNEAMRQGRDLEEYVARRFTAATGKKVRCLNGIIRNPEYPFALANIDRKIVGENAGLECKTTSVLNLRRYKNDEFPSEYYTQCVHYMAVTGYDKWYLAVLVLNTEFKVFEIERDEDEIAALMDAERDFWDRYVLTDTPPPADGFDGTTEAIRAIYADSYGGTVELFGRDSLIRNYYDQKAVRDAADRKMEAVKQTLMSDLGEAETGYCGPYKVTWKAQSRRSFNAGRFAADNPEIDLGGYYDITTFRKFGIKELI